MFTLNPDSTIKKIELYPYKDISEYIPENFKSYNEINIDSTYITLENINKKTGHGHALKLNGFTKNDIYSPILNSNVENNIALTDSEEINNLKNDLKKLPKHLFSSIIHNTQIYQEGDSIIKPEVIYYTPIVCKDIDKLISLPLSIEDQVILSMKPTYRGEGRDLSDFVIDRYNNTAWHLAGKTGALKIKFIVHKDGTLSSFETLEATRKNTISADESRFTTSLDGVFAVGDATNMGADIAIAAIGEAQKASVVIDRYLNGESVGYKKPYYVERDNKEIDYTKFEKSSREKMPHMAPAERKTNFKEVNFGFSEEMAKKEANRCLECGCHDYFECKLISYANDYDVKPSRFAGEKHNRNQENANDLIARNTDKCILCGLCVRVCEEVMGKSAIGLINRGFNTLVEPELGKHLRETECIACGQCVALCPTGALREKTAFTKSVPVKENSIKSICTNCSNLCDIDYRYIGSTVTRALPVGNGIICKGGRFGVLNEKKNTIDFDALLNPDTIVIGGKVSTETAFVLKKYAEENNKEIFTTAKETDANYYAISKLNIPQYNGNNQNAIETSPYYENGTFFDKYGNKRMQNAIFNGISLADYVNSKLNTPYSDLTTEAEKTVNATSTGKVTNEDIINASKLFK